MFIRVLLKFHQRNKFCAQRIRFANNKLYYSKPGTKKQALCERRGLRKRLQNNLIAFIPRFDYLDFKNKNSRTCAKEFQARTLGASLLSRK
jgi:hypothetical protein